jgi:hypothetical protein
VWRSVAVESLVNFLSVNGQSSQASHARSVYPGFHSWFRRDHCALVWSTLALTMEVWPQSLRNSTGPASRMSLWMHLRIRRGMPEPPAFVRGLRAFELLWTPHVHSATLGSAWNWPLFHFHGPRPVSWPPPEVSGVRLPMGPAVVIIVYELSSTFTVRFQP